MGRARSSWGLIGFAALAAACRREVPDHAPLLPPVVTVQEIAARAPAPLVRRGVTEYRTRVKVAFSRSGLVDRLLVDTGDVVTKGQLLATLRSSDAAAQLRGARAQAARAQRESDITTRLAQGGAIPAEQSESATTDLRLAEARADEAADVVDRSLLRAPISGVINDRFIEQGEFVSASAPVFALEDPRRVVVSVGLTSEEVSTIARDTSVDVTLDSTKRPCHGKISSVSPAPRPDGLHDVEVTLSSEAVPGEVAELSIPRGGPATLRVPVSALVYRRDHAQVFVVSDAAASKVAHLRSVDVARIDASEAVLGAGVAAGERVVAAGGYFLIDGQPVSAN